MTMTIGGDVGEILTATSGGLTANGGNGADTIIGGAGNDVIDGGRGADLIDGGAGDDLIFGGKGDDRFIWNPGGGNDTFDGGAGDDTLVYNTGDADEILSTLDFGGHAFVTGGVTLDLVGVERLSFAGSAAGSDVFFIAGLEGTDLKRIDVNLGLGQGGGDGRLDTVHIVGGPGDDHVKVAGSGADVSVTGLSVDLGVANAEAIDRLVVSGGDGDDTFDATAFGGGPKLVLSAGFGADSFEFAAGRHANVQIMDFGLAGEADLITLHGFADSSFDAAVSNQHIVQSGSDVAIADGSGLVLTLSNVSLVDLQARDFLFH